MTEDTPESVDAAPPGIVHPMSTTTPEAWTVVVAAGAGRRFGAEKQFAELDGDTVIGRSCRTAGAVSAGVVLVVADPAAPPVESLLRHLSSGPPLVVKGGTTRAASVRRGLAAVPVSARIVLVHDAARPLATPELYQRVIDAVAAGAPAVVPGIEVVDSLRRRSGGVVDRDGLVRVQTPQGFRADVLRAAHAGGADATDDAGLAEAAGYEVTIVDGDPANLKITTPADLAVASSLSSSIRADVHRGGASRGG